MRAIIVDDEAPGRKALAGMIEKYCRGIELVGMAESVAQGVELVLTEQPDLLFLDIQLSDGTGFDLLKQVEAVPFKLVVVSAFDEFALQAFEFSAINYLLKPLDPQRLITTVAQVAALREGERARIKTQSISLEHQLHKVALSMQNGIRFVEADQILRCEASGTYTVVHLLGGEQIAVTKGLGHFAKLLAQRGFFRCHHSHLINLHRVVEYTRGEGGSLRLEGGSEIEVSRRRKQDLLLALELG